MRRRHQRGQVIERSGQFYVRVYEDVIGQGRKRVSHWVCEKDQIRRSASCKAVMDEAAKVLARVNEQQDSAPRMPDMQVSDFWAEVYLPWCEKNLRRSSVAGYKRLWKDRLGPHFKRRTLKSYRPADATAWLTKLAGGMGRTTLSHCRALASAMFGHAVALGHLDSNPVRLAKCLAKPRPTSPTRAYTLDEAVAILQALAPRLDAQAVFSLSMFAGLRPSEVSALQWQDVDLDGGTLTIRRAAVAGKVSGTKTESSAASVAIIEPVLTLLREHRSSFKEPGPTDWCFPSRSGGPLNMESFCWHVVKPLVKAAELEWHGLYSARRGCASMLTQLSGNAVGAMQVLRHASIRTTETFYIKPSQAEGLRVMRLLEAATADTKRELGQD
jgi:integrase